MRFKTKKNVRERGSKTHGCGSMKKRRGAGNRGGRGMAGTGKRGDCKKPAIWKNKKYFGVHGFAGHKKKVKEVNITYLEGRRETLLEQGKIRKEGDYYILNLSGLGFDKLLSKGNATKKYKITCNFATQRAIENIKKAGGEVTVTNQ